MTAEIIPLSGILASTEAALLEPWKAWSPKPETRTWRP